VRARSARLDEEIGSTGDLKGRQLDGVVQNDVQVDINQILCGDILEL
jgi:hypothetical protein